ncbi:MAG: GldG family protein, partial [Actinomycetota bacterium]|nr:GldG family protein [Actinomycetota bacterium]
YEVLLTGEGDGQSVTDRAFLVVRPSAASDRSILLVLGTNTWDAYNDFGGTNLYNGGTHVSRQRPMAAGYLHKPPGAGRRVSSVNPPDPQIAAHIGYLMINHLSQWAGSAGWPNWEHPFVAWAEAAGYAFDVATNADLDANPDLLDRYALMLSVGHDEYWTAAERDVVEAFIARGGNVAFLTGNTSFWQVRSEDDGATMVGYKQRFADDPVYGTDRVAELTGIWSDHLIGRPENEMTGVSFARGGYARIGRRVPNGSGGYTVHRPGHWLFEGTGLEYGDLLGAAATVVGYECDGCDFTYRDGLPYPTHVDGTPEGFEILGTSPAASFTRETAARPPKPGQLSELEFHAERLFGAHDQASTDRLANGHAVLGTYTSPGGGTVVTSGCTDWAMGLQERDPQIEQVTRNLLDRLG